MKDIYLNNRLTRNIFDFYFKRIYRINKFDFFIIGAQKCGTTALFSYLDKHPSCMGASGKESLLFSTLFEGKIGNKEMCRFFMRKEWLKKYRKQLLFDATPENVYLEEVPQRIYNHNPEARLIFLVREPVSRAISEYNMACWYAKERNKCVREDPDREYFNYMKCPERYSFSWFIEEELRRIKETGSYLPSAFHYPDFIRHGLYSEQLKRYYKYFNPKQILILEDKELKNHKKEILYRVEDFLNIKHRVWKDEELVNSNVGVYSLPVQEDCKQYLTDFFRPWNEEFFQMIGRRMDW
jgi:hypothetical protein